MTNVYLGEFSNWKDVRENFAIGDPEPASVIAMYDTPPYEGYGAVIYWRDGALQYVEGSHCSCYGLEGQWKPEPFTVEQMRKMVAECNWGVLHQYRDQILEWLGPTYEG